MRVSTNRPRHVPRPLRPRQARLTLGSCWEGPTLAEFIERVEHEFGAAPDFTPMLAGDRSDPLAPAEIRALCEEIGVPADDFGV